MKMILILIVRLLIVSKIKSILTPVEVQATVITFATVRATATTLTLTLAAPLATVTVIVAVTVIATAIAIAIAKGIIKRRRSFSRKRKSIILNNRIQQQHFHWMIREEIGVLAASMFQN